MEATRKVSVSLLKNNGASLIVKGVYYLRYNTFVGKTPPRRGVMSQFRQDWCLRFLVDLTFEFSHAIGGNPMVYFERLIHFHWHIPAL